MAFFEENRFLFQDPPKPGEPELAGPPESGRASEGEVKRGMSSIEARMAGLVEKAGGKFMREDLKGKVASEFSEKIGAYFGSEKGSLSIDASKFDFKNRDKSVEQIAAAISPGLLENLSTVIGDANNTSEAIEWLRAQVKEGLKLVDFVKPYSKMVAERIFDGLVKAFPKLDDKDTKGLELLVTVSVKIGKDGEIVPEFKPTPEFKRAFEDAKAIFDQQEAVITDFMATANLAEIITTNLSDSYRGLEVKIEGYIGRDNWGNVVRAIKNQKSWKEFTAGYNNPDKLPADKLEEQIFERSRSWIARKIRLAVMDKIKREIESKNKNADIVAGMTDTIDLQVVGGTVSVSFRQGFEERYDAAVTQKESIPQGGDKIKVADLQGSWIGWVLMKVFGMKKDDPMWTAMVQGQAGPMSMFFGAIASHSDNPKFKYAVQFWDEGKEMLGKSPKTRGLIPSIDKFARSVAGFAGKYEKDPVKGARAKRADFFRTWATRRAERGMEGFAAVEEPGGRGWKLQEPFKLVSGESLRLRLGEGRRVIFPKDIAGVVKVGGGKVESGKELGEGEYIISSLDEIPKDTFFDNGVEYKIEKPA